MRMLEGIPQAQLEVMADLYPDDPDVQLEVVRRRRISLAAEQRALTRESRKLTGIVKRLNRADKK
jgi:hypothetical protein